MVKTQLEHLFNISFLLLYSQMMMWLEMNFQCVKVQELFELLGSFA